MSRSSRSTVRAHFSRRRVLRGLAGGAVIGVGLPWLETLVDPRLIARASSDGLFPKRFGMYFWGNGNRPDRWTPIGEGPGYTLSDELAPLAGHEDILTVLTGLSVKVDNLIPHWSGAAGVISGRSALGSGNDDWTVQVATIDQVIADAIGNDTIYRSLEIGVGSTESMSYNGPYSNNPAENDPLAFFDRIFGSGFAAGGGEPSPTLGWRRSVLDAVMADIEELSPTLGKSDQERLDQHLTSVRELELRLQRLQEDPPDLAACTTPATPDADYPDIEGRPPLAEIAGVMAELTAMALACDQTRVFTFLFTPPFNNILFQGASDGHHNLTHNEGGDQPEVHDITVQCITEFATLVTALRNIPEGDETLLDHCCVLASSETSEGQTHALDDIPLMYAGSACGSLVTGEHIRSFTSENANKAMLSIQRAMGVQAVEWGDGDSYTADGYPSIETGS